MRHGGREKTCGTVKIAPARTRERDGGSKPPPYISNVSFRRTKRPRNPEASAQGLFRWTSGILRPCGPLNDSRGVKDGASLSAHIGAPLSNPRSTFVLHSSTSGYGIRPYEANVAARRWHRAPRRQRYRQRTPCLPLGGRCRPQTAEGERAEKHSLSRLRRQLPHEGAGTETPGTAQGPFPTYLLCHSDGRNVRGIPKRQRGGFSDGQSGFFGPAGL